MYSKTTVRWNKTKNKKQINKANSELCQRNKKKIYKVKSRTAKIKQKTKNKKKYRRVLK